MIFLNSSVLRLYYLNHYRNIMLFDVPCLCCAAVVIRRSSHIIKWMSQALALIWREDSLGRWPGYMSMWQIWQQKSEDKYYLNSSCLILYGEMKWPLEGSYLTCIYIPAFALWKHNLWTFLRVTSPMFMTPSSHTHNEDIALLFPFLLDHNRLCAFPK